VTRAPVWIAVALLALHAGILLDGIGRHFVVVDESGHVPSALATWRTGRFDAYRVNPPLPRLIATLPLLPSAPRLDLRKLDAPVDHRVEWDLALDFARQNPDTYLGLVRRARLAGVAWSLIGGWLIFAWGRSLDGPWAGLLGLALWCVEPLVLAFAQVVIPDVPAAVAGLGASYAYWTYLKAPTRRRALIAGGLLGLALLTKSTLLVLYPTWLVLAAVPYLTTIDRRWLDGGLVIAASLLVLNLGYAFRGSGRSLGSYEFSSDLLAGNPADRVTTANRFRPTPFSVIPIPLPADFVAGLDLQRRDFEAGLPSYMRGHWRVRGWWYYYLYGMGVKLPLGTLALVVAGVVAAGIRLTRRSDPIDDLAWLLPSVAIIALVSSQTGMNHHLRYVLPAYPFLFVGAGRLVASAGRSRWARAALVLAVVVSAASVARVLPHAMSYFNEAAGGPARGDEHLIDSNLDWGQDLLFLKRWIDAHPEARPLHLASYHIIDPRLAGIAYELPPLGPTGLFPDDPEYGQAHGPRVGYYAVSVNHLRGSTFPAPDGRGGHHFAVRGDFEYFRRFRPIDRAGYSIRIYYLSASDVAAERQRLGLPP